MINDFLPSNLMPSIDRFSGCGALYNSTWSGDTGICIPGSTNSRSSDHSESLILVILSNCQSNNLFVELRLKILASEVFSSSPKGSTDLGLVLVDLEFYFREIFIHFFNWSLLQLNNSEEYKNKITWDNIFIPRVAQEISPRNATNQKSPRRFRDDFIRYFAKERPC